MQTEKRIAYEQVAGHLPKGLPYPPAAMFEHPLQAHYALEEQMSPAMMSMNPNSAWMAQRMSLPPAYSKMAWRKGKWLDEEEAYTKKLIEAFNAGYLNIPSGTTLRSFLSERLSW